MTAKSCGCQGQISGKPDAAYQEGTGYGAIARLKKRCPEPHREMNATVKGGFAFLVSVLQWLQGFLQVPPVGDRQCSNAGLAGLACLMWGSYKRAKHECAYMFVAEANAVPSMKFDWGFSWCSLFQHGLGFCSVPVGFFLGYCPGCPRS